MKKMVFLLSLTMFLSGYAANADQERSLTFVLGAGGSQTVLDSYSSDNDVENLLISITDLPGNTMVRIKGIPLKDLVHQDHHLAQDVEEIVFNAGRFAWDDSRSIFLPGSLKEHVRRMARALRVVRQV